MLQIRKNVFETNSSSTHSMVIPKQVSKRKLNTLKHIDFHFGEFGRPIKTICVNPADYLYTAIYCRGKNHIKYDYSTQDTCPQKLKDLIEEDLAKLRLALDIHGITYTFEEPIWGDRMRSYYDNDEDYAVAVLINSDHDPWYGWINEPMYLDHASEDEIGDFLDHVLNDPEILIRYLANGKVYVGSDESSSYENSKVNRDEPVCIDYKFHNEYDYSDPRHFEEITKPNKFYLGDGWETKYDFFIKRN